MSASSSAPSVHHHPVPSAEPRPEATLPRARRVIAVVRRLARGLARLPRWDDERIAQHRDTVYRQVQRLPIA